MRHLIGLTLLSGAAVAYAAGWGPLCFGAPLPGVLLLVLGLGLESRAWLRFRRRPLLLR